MLRVTVEVWNRIRVKGPSVLALPAEKALSGECMFTHTLQDTTLVEAGVNYWFLTPQAARNWERNLSGSIHTVLELIRKHC